MLNSGDVFAGFTIERLLGQGGMGSVYLARHPRLGRLTALKLLNRELFADREVRARFEREADLVAQLEHPNIVAVYDRGSEDAQLWISMQYVDGVDAASVQVATLPPERAVQIIEGVADALDYAHTTGVLHRDVKPANIMLARSVAGHGERVFLADFGIARLREDSTHLTQAGMFTATLAYASPEQMTGAPLDHSTDQYSLACALYWLLIGIGPFDSPHPSEIIRGHLQLMPYPASMRRPGISPAMDAVINRAMAKRPVDRFSSCAEFAAAARRALKEPPALPAPPVQSGPTFRYPPNNPAGQQPSPPGYAPPLPGYAAPPQPYPPPGYQVPPQGPAAAPHGQVPPQGQGAAHGQVPPQGQGAEQGQGAPPGHHAPQVQAAPPPGYPAPSPAYAASHQNHAGAPSFVAPPVVDPPDYPAVRASAPGPPGYAAPPASTPAAPPTGQPPQSRDPARQYADPGQRYASATPVFGAPDSTSEGAGPHPPEPGPRSAGPRAGAAVPSVDPAGRDDAPGDAEFASAATEQMAYPAVPQRHPVGVAVPAQPGPAESAQSGRAAPDVSEQPDAAVPEVPEQSGRAVPEQFGAVPAGRSAEPEGRSADPDRAGVTVDGGVSTPVTTPVGYLVAPHRDSAGTAHPEDSAAPVGESAVGVSFSRCLGGVEGAQATPSDSVTPESDTAIGSDEVRARSGAARAGAVSVAAESGAGGASAESDADQQDSKSGSGAARVDSAGGTESDSVFIGRDSAVPRESVTPESEVDIDSGEVRARSGATSSEAGSVAAGSSSVGAGAESVAAADDAVSGVGGHVSDRGDAGVESGSEDALSTGTGHSSTGPEVPGSGVGTGGTGGGPGFEVPAGAPTAYGAQGVPQVGPGPFGPPQYPPNTVPPQRIPPHRPGLGDVQPGVVVVLALAVAVLLTLLALIVLNAVG
ncbi:protein kinase [Nocardia uniformis]|uniref:non-specific serine/threonine protein kinase n=1 Tax=Nocardia uniformis TaxID=53432 RepID=A0A849C875_9NOCA|nr:serine/threonine-protein kinase [Nocardia uniformis]NNH72570.1 protein kinase [Nocardia uniformis]